MTPEELEAEIKSLRQQQEDQKRNWFRWGLASFGIFTVLYIVIGIKMAITGADPPPPMMFIALTFLFLLLPDGRSRFGFGFGENKSKAPCTRCAWLVNRAGAPSSWSRMTLMLSEPPLRPAA
jgi:hypothetical protein